MNSPAQRSLPSTITVIPGDRRLRLGISNGHVLAGDWSGDDGGSRAGHPNEAKGKSETKIWQNPYKFNVQPP